MLSVGRQTEDKVSVLSVGKQKEDRVVVVVGGGGGGTKGRQQNASPRTPN